MRSWVDRDEEPGEWGFPDLVVWVVWLIAIVWLGAFGSVAVFLVWSF